MEGDEWTVSILVNGDPLKDYLNRSTRPPWVIDFLVSGLYVVKIGARCVGLQIGRS